MPPPPIFRIEVYALGGKTGMDTGRGRLGTHIRDLIIIILSPVLVTCRRGFDW
jgi:hypothetical protein